MLIMCIISGAAGTQLLTLMMQGVLLEQLMLIMRRFPGAADARDARCA